MGVKFGVCFLLIRPVVGKKVIIVLNFFSQPVIQSNHIKILKYIQSLGLDDVLGYAKHNRHQIKIWWRLTSWMSEAHNHSGCPRSQPAYGWPFVVPLRSIAEEIVIQVVRTG